MLISNNISSDYWKKLKQSQNKPSKFNPMNKSIYVLDVKIKFIPNLLFHLHLVQLVQLILLLLVQLVLLILLHLEVVYRIRILHPFFLHILSHPHTLHDHHHPTISIDLFQLLNRFNLMNRKSVNQEFVVDVFKPVEVVHYPSIIERKIWNSYPMFVKMIHYNVSDEINR